MKTLMILLLLQGRADPLLPVREECKVCEPDCKLLQAKSEGILLTRSPGIQVKLLRETLEWEGYKGSTDRFIECALLKAYDRAGRVLRIGRSKHLSEVQLFRWNVIETILRIHRKHGKMEIVKIRPRRKGRNDENLPRF